MTTEPEQAPMDDQPEAETPAAEIPSASAEPSDRIAELEAEVARMKDHLLRAMAETENTRKRAVKEREDATRFAVTGFARDMLEIADNFRRALDALPQETKDSADPMLKNLLAGIEATERVLLKTFEKHGIRKIEPLGEPFDPHFHEVMFEAPVPGKSAGTIIQLVEPGYVLHDRLLRPARVGVAKGDPGGSDGSAHKIDETV